MFYVMCTVDRQIRRVGSSSSTIGSQTAVLAYVLCAHGFNAENAIFFVRTSNHNVEILVIFQELVIEGPRDFDWKIALHD